MNIEEKKALFEEFCQFIDSKEVVNDTVDVQRTITVSAVTMLLLFGWLECTEDVMKRVREYVKETEKD